MVRRTFLARRNGESPATAAVLTPSAPTQPGWTANKSVTSSQTASALLAAGETASSTGIDTIPHGWTKIAISASEGDLQSLSFVLDMALSILFARAAVVNLLTHVAADGGPRCHPLLLTTFSCPPLRFEPPTKKRPGASSGVREGLMGRASAHGSRGGETGVVMDVAQGILDMLLVQEDQHRIVDLTKALATW